MFMGSEILHIPKNRIGSQDKTLTTDELIRSNRELEQFAFTASHDLQEPLKAISLYLQLYHKKYSGKLGDQADEAISRILDKTNRMQKLIQNILNYSRVGKEDVELVKLNSDLILKRAIGNLNATIKENLAQITHETLPIVMGNNIQLMQLFQNLISNAIKFSKGDDFPRIHISFVQKDRQWVFLVQDNGIGIAQKDIQKIFDIFHRLHSSSEYGGNGIGLALCKRIVESHGGKIWIESEVGKGTAVYFTMGI